MFVCVFAFACACMEVHIHVCMCACVCPCMYVFVYVFICVCVCMFLYVCIHVCAHAVEKLHLVAVPDRRFEYLYRSHSFLLQNRFVILNLAIYVLDNKGD